MMVSYLIDVVDGGIMFVMQSAVNDIVSMYLLLQQRDNDEAHDHLMLNRHDGTCRRSTCCAY